MVHKGSQSFGSSAAELKGNTAVRGKDFCSMYTMDTRAALCSIQLQEEGAFQMGPFQ